ncbi:MAG: ROK family protein [Culicoidibacterales bacterium]
MDYILAFDIGGTSIKYGLLDRQMKIMVKYEVETAAYQGGMAVIEKIIAIARELRLTNKLIGIAISTAGQVDVANGKIIGASHNIPEYEGLAFKAILEECLGLPTYIDNDVNCVALAEAYCAENSAAKTLFAMTLGTGIGGAFVQDKQVYYGSNYIAGEIGYLPIGTSNLEQLASTGAFLAQVTKCKGGVWDGVSAFAAIYAGDEEIIALFDEVLSHLATAIVMIICFYDPEVIVIGGGISAQGSYFLPILEQKIALRMPSDILPQVSLKLAYYGNDAGMIGACRNLLARLDQGGRLNENSVV